MKGGIPPMAGVAKLPIGGFKLQLTESGCPLPSVASKVAAWLDVSKTVWGVMFTLGILPPYECDRALPGGTRANLRHAKSNECLMTNVSASVQRRCYFWGSRRVEAPSEVRPHGPHPSDRRI